MFKLFKIVYRIFEPARKQKVATFKMLTYGLISFLWWNLLPIISLPILIKYINDKDINKIFNFCLFIIVIYLLLWLIHFMIRSWGNIPLYDYKSYLYKTYLKKSLLKDNVEMEKIGTGKIQSIIMSGINSSADLNDEISFQFIKVSLGILTGVYLIYQFEPKYSPYFIILVIISASSYYFFKNKRLKYDTQINDIDNELDKKYVRMIMSRQEILLNSSENKELKDSLKLINNQKLFALKLSKFQFLDDLSVSGPASLLPFLGVLLFIRNIELTPLNIGFLVSFIYFTGKFSETVYNMTWSIGRVFQSYPTIKKLWDFIDNTKDYEGYNAGKKFQYKNGEIELKDINFSYEEKEILKNFNLKIGSRQKIAFIGRSGSGKTTIVKLISGFMRPNSGQILIDNQDLSEIALKSFYRHIGYLTQEPMVFDGTIKENLTYSLDEKELEKIDNQKLNEVLKLAECDFVKDLNTEIGEKGIRLSGGERQRLAIAKLMLKNPEIIILDEPTSALDSFSEDAITRALDKLFQNKTVIIIAHRLQTVRKADKIYVIENGKIIEEGDHNDLKEKEGQYKKMLDLQVGE